MYIAIIVEPEFTKRKAEMEQSGKKESRLLNKEKPNIGESEDELQIEDDPRDSPLNESVDEKTAIIQQIDDAFHSFDNKVEYFSPSSNLLQLFEMGKFDLIITLGGKRVFNNLAPQYAGLFEISGVPQVGSKLDAIAACSDKPLFRNILQLNRIPTPQYRILHIHPTINIPPNVISQGNIKSQTDSILRYPLIAKIYTEGSHLKRTPDIILASEEKFFEFYEKITKEFAHATILLEEYLLGSKYYLPVYGEEITEKLHFLPMMEIKPAEDISSKNIGDKKTSSFDATILDSTVDIVKRARKILQKAYNFFDFRDYVMAVFIHDKKSGNLLLHELNPYTSLMPGSKIVKSAAHVGLSYSDLIKDIILNALKRMDFKIRGKYHKRLKLLRKECDDKEETI